MFEDLSHPPQHIFDTMEEELANGRESAPFGSSTPETSPDSSLPVPLQIFDDRDLLANPLESPDLGRNLAGPDLIALGEEPSSLESLHSSSSSDMPYNTPVEDLSTLCVLASLLPEMIKRLFDRKAISKSQRSDNHRLTLYRAVTQFPLAFVDAHLVRASDHK